MALELTFQPSIIWVIWIIIMIINHHNHHMSYIFHLQIKWLVRSLGTWHVGGHRQWLGDS